MRILKKAVIGLFALTLFDCNPAAGQNIALNEILASNSGVIADEDGDYEDWIELHNFGREPVSLENWGLSDDYGNLFRWVFPAGAEIGPGEFLLVWASGKDRRDPAAPLHTNFSIKSAGEEVLLTAPSGERIDELVPVEIPTDISYGRRPDGTGEWFFFDEPTPGSGNVTPRYTEILDPPVFSRPGGFYPGEFDLKLSHPDPEVTIVYTLDGSAPDPGNLEGISYYYKDSYPEKAGQPFGEFLVNSYRSRLYSDLLAISDRSGEADRLTRISSTWHRSPGYFPDSPVRKGTVVRAGAYKEGALSGPAETHTYFVGPDVDRSRLPVFSISLDEAFFFDYRRGIYVAGEDFDEWRRANPEGEAEELTPANYHRRGAQWEYPAHLEVFIPGEAGAGLRQDLGVRIHGGQTRACPVKSLRLYARNLYGSRVFGYPFFPGLPDEDFRRLILRNSGQDGELTLIRDAAIQEIVGDLRFDTQAYRPAVVFINGEYWGIHNLRERYDRHYLARVHGVDPDRIDLLENDAVVREGDGRAYRALLEHLRDHDLSAGEHYSYVRDRIDIGNFLDYQAAQIFAANTDWPGNNIRYWRAKTDNLPGSAGPGDGRWRWLLYDTDFGFGGCGRPEAYTHDTLAYAADPDGRGAVNPPWSTFLLRSLLESPDFTRAFITRFADLLNTAFRPERTVGVINGMKENIADEIPAHVHRWSRPVDWEENVGVMNDFARRRPAHQRRHLRDYFGLEGEVEIRFDVSDPRQGHLRLNTVEIRGETPGVEDDPYPWTGVYFAGVPVELEAVPAPGYEFSRWEGLEGEDGPLVVFTPEGETAITASFRPSRELHPVHYWHFNDLPGGEFGLVPADYSLSGEAAITYPGTGGGYMDRRTHRDGDPVSGLNLARGEEPGRGAVLRLRNPSDTRKMLISADFSGYRDLRLSYAVTRTPNGATGQRLYFSSDRGKTWEPLAEYEVPLLPAWELKSFDLSDRPHLENLSDLRFRILFTGESARGESGNNRFDNITIEGRRIGD